MLDGLLTGSQPPSFSGLAGLLFQAGSPVNGAGFHVMKLGTSRQGTTPIKDRMARHFIAPLLTPIDLSKMNFCLRQATPRNFSRVSRRRRCLKAEAARTIKLPHRSVTVEGSGTTPMLLTEMSSIAMWLPWVDVSVRK